MTTQFTNDAERLVLAQSIQSLSQDEALEFAVAQGAGDADGLGVGEDAWVAAENFKGKL